MPSAMSLYQSTMDYEEFFGDGEGSRTDPSDNVKRVTLCCEERRFNEGSISQILLKTPGGLAFLMKPGANALLKKTNEIARVIVFNETVSQRIDRCKSYQLKRNPEANKAENVNQGCNELVSILTSNGIDVATFAHVTYKHLTRQLGKKNHLLFYGPPSTGKSMIMDSLVSLHYNFAVVPGLPLNMKFFSSLVHHNACFLKGCELKSSRYMEHWRFLAAGSPLSTNKGNVERCVVYSCGYQEGRLASDMHTTSFRFTEKVMKFTDLSVFVWLKFWREFGLEI